MLTSRRFLLPAFLLPAGLCALAFADGSAIDKVYHPYVDPLEWELEWRVVHADQDPVSGKNNRQLHRLALGRAVFDTVFAELYLLGARTAQDDMNLQAYEVEIMWQLTEQGEYSLDYGLLFELEKVHGDDRWEYATTLLLEREMGRFSATANLGLGYEWGGYTDDEIETTLALQARYRYSARLEPALELYLGEDTRGLGPVLMGRERLGPARALRWEFGIVFGLEQATPDYTVRGLLEYEF
jgi:hypothetical protein